MADDMVLAAGEEILATYGAHPNDKLLIHYGFILDSPAGPSNDDDIRSPMPVRSRRHSRRDFVRSH